MKKILVLLSFCIFCYTSYSQNFSEEEFEEKYSEMAGKISNSLMEKNYTEAQVLIMQSIELLNVLPEEEKEDYSFLFANDYYNLACIYSLQNNKDKAIDNFAKSIEHGYTNYSHAINDSDFVNVRDDSRFINLLASIREAGDYIYILQNAGKYQKEDTTGYPAFNYEPVDNWRIKNVKNYFKLDSVAGDGDELSQIINLMTWVHNTIPHDGSHFPNCETDAVDIYNYSKANDNKGVNCRALAIVLNECYLSMGFKSRFITCLPKNENDADCHVINSVFSRSLNKWIWMDPTFNAYIKDDRGNLLSIQEVRQHLINNQPIVLNADANWNNTVAQTKENYIDGYMSKNLYWLQCPANSYFNIESPYRNNNQKYISLIPAGYEPKTISNNFNTHDPEYFWHAPKFEK